MVRLRDVMTENSDMALPEAFLSQPDSHEGLKTIRELAIFRFTCRKCEDAPCVNVCPADALEKDENGIISRHTNLCISCKSCVTICPFGTIMTDFFRHHLNKDLFYDLNDEEEIKKFIIACPPGTASLTEEEESPERNVYRLNEKVLIRDYLYLNDKL